jgi:hypothetical protein
MHFPVSRSMRIAPVLNAQARAHALWTSGSCMSPLIPRKPFSVETPAYDAYPHEGGRSMPQWEAVRARIDGGGAGRQDACAWGHEHPTGAHSPGMLAHARSSICAPSPSIKAAKLLMIALLSGAGNQSSRSQARLGKQGGEQARHRASTRASSVLQLALVVVSTCSAVTSLSLLLLLERG